MKQGVMHERAETGWKRCVHEMRSRCQQGFGRLVSCRVTAGQLISCAAHFSASELGMGSTPVVLGG
jgi:1-aminocyclopropane-1-carboxylate deaminase/D-cysteine desulfhydrase-like pyridoxal-dependent ACC family enzyme